MNHPLPPVVESAAEPDLPWQVALRRLRWRSRRGLLENDLVMGRFFEAYGATLNEAQVLALEALLDLPDGELLDLILGRQELTEDMQKDAAVVQVLHHLRTV